MPQWKLATRDPAPCVHVPLLARGKHTALGTPPRSHFLLGDANRCLCGLMVSGLPYSVDDPHPHPLFGSAGHFPEYSGVSGDNRFCPYFVTLSNVSTNGFERGTGSVAIYQRSPLYRGKKGFPWINSSFFNRLIRSIACLVVIKTLNRTMGPSPDASKL